MRWLLVIAIICGIGLAIWLVPSANHAPDTPPTGTISGVVQDDDGPVAGAVVRVRATDLSTTADADGCFVLGELAPGQAVDLTAWAPGYFISGGQLYLPGAEDVVLSLEAHAGEDDAGYAWLSAYADAGEAGNCENCHAGDGTLPFDEWVTDAHSQSAVNPRFLTMYMGTDTAGNASPSTTYAFLRDYGRFPLRPDTSKSYYGPGYQLDFPATAGNCAACHAPAAAIDAPYSTDPSQVTGVGTEGVACDFCHKVSDIRLDPDTGLPYANMPGVLSFEYRRPSEDHQFFSGPYDDVGFEGSEDTFVPLQTESQYCAACHFGSFWNVTVYNSFGEWLDSPYSDPETGKTCQDCHMPPVGVTQVADHEQSMERDPATIFSHQMPGAADEELLQNTAKLGLHAERDSGQIVVTVDVTNTKVGHHIPTDSPLRQILVVVTATDAQNDALPLAEGPVLPDWAGDLQGMPGVYFAKILQEIWTEAMPTGAYWNPTRVVEDTRLAAFETNISTYTFDTPDEVGSITVEARLIFRRAFYDLMQQKGWDVPDILMEQEQLTIE